jgi:hypothetical protein
MEKVNSFGAIKVPMMVTFTRTIFTVTVNTFGLMAESTMDNGWTTKWKDKELLPGVTAEDMSDSTRMIRSTDKVPLSGQMAESISENGTKGNNTEKEHI